MVSQLATETFDLGEATIGKGDAVVLQLSGANRDPQRFADAGRFDVAREDNRHLAFGWGTHFCLGHRWRGWKPQSCSRRSPRCSVSWRWARANRRGRPET